MRWERGIKMYNPCPCTPDCPKRSAFCRLYCREGLEYDRRQKERYKTEFNSHEADRLLSEGAVKALHNKRLHSRKGW